LFIPAKELFIEASVSGKFTSRGWCWCGAGDGGDAVRVRSSVGIRMPHQAIRKAIDAIMDGYMGSFPLNRKI
jgi:hypothetical protein